MCYAQVTLKFVFANKDGVTVEQSTDLETLVSDVKNALISSWPEGMAQEAPPPSSIRLICMGHGILADNKTLEGARAMGP